MSQKRREYISITYGELFNSFNIKEAISNERIDKKSNNLNE